METSQGTKLDRAMSMDRVVEHSLVVLIDLEDHIANRQPSACLYWVVNTGQPPK